MPTEPARRRWRRRALFAVFGSVLLAGLVALGHALVARNHPDLRPWHRVVPAGEPGAAELDAGMDFAAYLARERAVLDVARRRVEAELGTADAGGGRYAPRSPMNPSRFAIDWNRSFERVPDASRGGALLIHGMTDSPYSMRALADVLAQQGWRVLVLRMQGHGSVPAALLDVHWEDWAASVRLGMRHLRAAVGADRPLLIVGYSTGGALALKHQLDALEDPLLPRAQRMVLISPLIGLSRSAGLAPLLSLLGGVPGFEKSAWLEVQPEYNPFKYNSFPVNGAWQSHRLTSALSAQFERLRAAGRLAELPPLLTFHSVLDTTVQTDAVVHRLYDRLPANGSELVIFDVNRWNVFAPLFRAGQLDYLSGLFASGRRDYALSVITNMDPTSLAVQEQRLAAGSTTAVDRSLGLSFPPEVFSLSHIALPFAPDDPLYGLAPRADEDFGVRLGRLALRGERYALQVPMEQLARLGSNPFFPYLAQRVADWSDAAAADPNER